MKTTAILILLANLWHLAPHQSPSHNPLRAIFDLVEEIGGNPTTQQDPPDDGKVIFLPPPR